MNKIGMTQKVLVFVIVGLVMLAIFFFFIYKTKESGYSLFDIIKQEFDKIIENLRSGTAGSS
ncbi:MAG: LPXTG cell wall anchor domain-containing protein [Candidatus Aenigmarchaeota archaeon]|nr:LPXTG cell wall anchor domain-containing protein [Candidatus Aenigmarchaeota archaeon]